MELKWRDGFWLLLGLFITGCAGFAYRNYGMDGVDYSQGTLVGDVSSNDVPFSRCAPGPQIKHPCTVLFSPEFYAMKQELLDTRQKLKECEQARQDSSVALE
jgi:hypothetical protein